MKWQIIRDENKEISEYRLNNNIFIKRIYTTNYNKSKFYHYLYINNKCVDATENGYTTLKELKEKGERIREREDKK